MKKTRDNVVQVAIGIQGVGKSYTTFHKEVLPRLADGSTIAVFDANGEFFNNREYSDELKKQGYQYQILPFLPEKPSESATAINQAAAQKKQIWCMMPRYWHISKQEIPSQPDEKRPGIIKSCITWLTAKTNQPKPDCKPENLVRHKLTGGQIFNYDQKRQAAISLMQNFNVLQSGRKNGLIVLEDINSYLPSIHNDQEAVGVIINVRHRGVDIICHIQNCHDVPTRFYREAAVFRLHYDTVAIPNHNQKCPADKYPPLRIGQIIVSRRYKRGETRFFVYVLFNDGNRYIDGVGFDEFVQAAKMFLAENPAFLKPFKAMSEPENRWIAENLYIHPRFRDHANVKSFLNQYLV